MKKKREILHNFWLAEKKIKIMKFIFLNREGGRDRDGKVEVGEITCKPNNV